MRIVRSVHNKSAQGNALYTPADMYHYILLDPRERLLLRKFKQKFGGTTEWTDVLEQK